MKAAFITIAIIFGVVSVFHFLFGGLDEDDELKGKGWIFFWLTIVVILLIGVFT